MRKGEANFESGNTTSRFIIPNTESLAKYQDRHHWFTPVKTNEKSAFIIQRNRKKISLQKREIESRSQFIHSSSSFMCQPCKYKILFADTKSCFYSNNLYLELENGSLGIFFLAVCGITCFRINIK